MPAQRKDGLPMKTLKIATQDACYRYMLAHITLGVGTLKLLSWKKAILRRRVTHALCCAALTVQRWTHLEEVSVLAFVESVEVGAQVRNAFDDCQDLGCVYNLALQGHSVQRGHRSEHGVEDACLVAE